MSLHVSTQLNQACPVIGRLRGHSGQLGGVLRTAAQGALRIAGLLAWTSCDAPNPQTSIELEQLPARALEAPNSQSANAPSVALAAATTSGATPRLRPLPTYEWLTELASDPQVVDFVTPPLGASEPRPLVIAIHGAGDRPNWACGGWRIGVENFAFTLCPMGHPVGGGRYAWKSAADIGAAIDRARHQFNQRFVGYLAPTAAIYAGFSQGATLARSILVRRAKEFPLAALAEGGYDYLVDAHFANEYREAGGRKLLLLCGTPGCLITMNRATKILRTSGLMVRVASAPDAGHNLNRELQCALRRTEGFRCW